MSLSSSIQIKILYLIRVEREVQLYYWDDERGQAYAYPNN